MPLPKKQKKKQNKTKNKTKQNKTKQNRQSVSVQKNFARCGPKNSARATKAGIFIIKKCGWKNLEKNENAVTASRLKIPTESLQDAEREDDGEYCEESWQRFKGRTIMSGETLVEKLHEAVCCRVCHPDVTFLENVNCKSCVSRSLFVTQLLALVTRRSLLDLEPRARRLRRGFQRAFLSCLLSSFLCQQLDLSYPFFLLVPSALYSRREIMRVKFPVLKTF